MGYVPGARPGTGMAPPTAPGRHGTAPVGARRRGGMRHHHKFRLVVASAVSAGGVGVGAGPADGAGLDSRPDRHTGHRGRSLREGERTAPSPGDAITACGTNRRQQNEPSTAVDARNSFDRGGRVERLLHGRAGRGHLGGLLPQHQLRSALDRQPAAGLSDRHLAGGAGQPAAAARDHQRRRPGAGLGPAGPAVLHGQRLQPGRTAERLGLGRDLRPGRRPLRPHGHRG